MKISLIAAVAQNGVIGSDNKLPWNLPEDLRRFKELTLGKAVIMGRKTYESIGRPLPERFNIVITSNKKYLNDARAQDLRIIFVPSLDSAIFVCRILKFDEVFVAGGAGIYREALEKDLVDMVYLTKILKDFDGDTSLDISGIAFPKWDMFYEDVRTTEDFVYSFVEYERNR